MNQSLPTHHPLKYAGIGVAAIVIGALIAIAFIDDPLRAFIERRVNQSLDGYRFTIGSLDFHPIGFSIDLENVVLVRTQHPDEPILKIPFWSASVHWQDLLRGALVSDHHFLRPALQITRAQAVEEAGDTRALTERGWQKAVLAVYPLEVNELDIVDGDISYADSPTSKPLRLQGVHFRATNIRNIESPDHTYPSRVSLRAQVFGSGQLTVDGKADFLAQPHVGVDAQVELTDIPLADLLPLTGRANVILREGILKAKRHVEYSPSVKNVEIQDLAVNRLRMDYVHAAGAAKKERPVAEAAVKQATEVRKEPNISVRMERGQITNSELGFVNKETVPGYRVFLAQINMQIEDLSNTLDRETAGINLEGRFMGNGKLTTRITIRPQNPLPDFDLKVKILKTKLPSMNNLLRAHANADVKEGSFTFFSELTVQNGKVTGYVRPFFKDVDVYDPEQDKDKGFLQTVYEGLLEDLADVFKNVPREQVATEATVTGPLSDPRTSTWEILVNLIKNAFFKAIVPGFKKTLQP